jgi:hypothetical protein
MSISIEELPDWFKSYILAIIKSSNMTAKLSFERMQKISSQVIEELNKHFITPDHQSPNLPYQIIEKTDNSLKFKVLNRTLLIKAELAPFAGVVYYKTYEIKQVLGQDKKEEYTEITELEIVQNNVGYIRFVKKKEIPSLYGGAEEKTDVTFISNVGSQYDMWMLYGFNQQENKDYESKVKS